MAGGPRVAVAGGWIPVLGVEGGSIIVGGAEVDRTGPGWISGFGLGGGNMVVGGAGMEGSGPGVTLCVAPIPWKQLSCEHSC